MSIPRSIEAGIIYSEPFPSAGVTIRTTTITSQSKPITPGSYSISKGKITRENLRILTHSAVFWRDHDTSRPAIKMRYLPSTRPARPEKLSEAEWAQRVVVGNAYYHLYLTPAKVPGQKSNPSVPCAAPPTDRPVQCEGLVLKLAETLDDNEEKWHYEDFPTKDFTSPRTQGELRQIMSDVSVIVNTMWYGDVETLAKVLSTWNLVVEE